MMKPINHLIPVLLVSMIVTSDASGAVTTHIASTGRFEFHSDPWLNAHHFLYQWARADEGIGEGRAYVNVTERESLGHLPEADRRVWMEALSFYRKSVAPLDHFDDAMLGQNIDLLKLEGKLDATPGEKIRGLAAALAAAMPVYRKYWWEQHDKSNRSWVNEIFQPLQACENDFVKLTARLFAAQWPDERRRVDVSAYANFAAGYTALGHIVIYSTDPGNQGLYGLETMLHEVQHTREVAGVARRELRAAFQLDDRYVPQNLWHSIIFATAGEFVRGVAADNEIEHQPYWMREGFDSLSGWTDAVQAVNLYWLPVVGGKSDRADAFVRLREHYLQMANESK